MLKLAVPKAIKRVLAGVAAATDADLAAALVGVVIVKVALPVFARVDTTVVDVDCEPLAVATCAVPLPHPLKTPAITSITIAQVTQCPLIRNRKAG